MAFVCSLFRNCYSNYNATIGQMDKFVTKSPLNSDEKSLKRKGNDCDKQYDAKKRKRYFQMSWLT